MGIKSKLHISSFFYYSFWCFFLMCLDMEDLKEKVSSQKSHLSLIPSWNDAIWASNHCFEAYDLLHVGQTNAFSCTLLICWLKWHFCPNESSHCVHLKTFSPRWTVLMWTFNPDGLLNKDSHWSQGCAFFGPFLAAGGFLAFEANLICLAFGSSLSIWYKHTLMDNDHLNDGSCYKFFHFYFRS